MRRGKRQKAKGKRQKAKGKRQKAKGSFVLPTSPLPHEKLFQQTLFMRID
jgi:hypothetical protein